MWSPPHSPRGACRGRLGAITGGSHVAPHWPPAAVALPAQPATARVDAGGAVPFMDLPPEGCRWIEGEPSPDPMACGRRRVGRSAYCPEHLTVATLPS
jgi:hypothetical protein